MTKQIYKCIIIGSGPAGYSAAIYAARFNLQPILFTGQDIGGQLTKTTYVDNYPGFHKGIKGPDLMDNLKNQALRFNTKIIYKDVLKVKLNENTYHKVYVENNEFLRTKGIIITTGSSPKYLNINNEKQLIGKGVSTCAICDGFFYKKKNVAVIGGGDTAVEEAIYLSKISNYVHVIVRKNKFRASKIMQTKIFELVKKNINIIFNNFIIKIIGSDSLKKIIISDNQNNIRNLNIDGLFLAIGSNPNSEIFKNQINLDKKGYIITKPGSTKTNITGVFAAGDVQDYKFKQAVTSAGTGCMAAIELNEYLSTI